MVLVPEGLHGAFLRAEIQKASGSNVMRAMLAHGTFVVYSRSVVVLQKRRLEFRTRAGAALLHVGPDAVLTGYSALVNYGCAPSEKGPIHVRVPYSRRTRPHKDLALHRGMMAKAGVRVLDRLPTVALEFALAEVLCRGERRDGIACADRVLASLPQNERPAFRRVVARCIAERPDPRGQRRGRMLLELATGLAESPAESWVLAELAAAGLPVPTCQYRLFDLAGNEIYRLDFAWPELRIAVEYDGYEAHEHRTERDATRDADLQRRGWIVIRMTSADLRDPTEAIAAIRAAFARRGVNA